MSFPYRTKINAQAIAGIWNKLLEPFSWFEIKAEETETAEILIYDFVGWPFNDAGELTRKLSDLGGMPVNVRIHSPGGDVFDAMAIYNAFKTYPGTVTTIVDSMAASSASIIMLAGKEVRAYQNSMIMVHEPWAYMCGNQFELRDFADILGKISGNMVDLYAENSNLGKKEVKALLRGDGKQDGTYMTAKEAKDKGFIDTIIDQKATAKAEFYTPYFAAERPDILTIKDAERALREAGFSRDKAKALLARGWQQAASDDFSEIGNLLTETFNILRKEK
jgi:ATP-dependent protease ClpP protease subunit